MKLLDLFCGAGGAAMGYHRAGFTEIVGVDIKPMPRYPFQLIQGDALEYVAAHGHEFDAIHASPPCQGYSIMHNLPWLRGRDYPLLLLPTVEILESIKRPYVVENVMGARFGAKGLARRGLESHALQAGWLCGTMFGLPFYRHRLFATNWFWLAPGHPRHTLNLHPRAERWVYGGNVVKELLGGAAGIDIKPHHPNPVNTAWRATHDGHGLSDWQDGEAVGIGHAAGWRHAAAAMGIDWMDLKTLTQAIPPVYTEYIGRHLLAYLKAQATP